MCKRPITPAGNGAQRAGDCRRTRWSKRMLKLASTLSLIAVMMGTLLPIAGANALGARQTLISLALVATPPSEPYAEVPGPVAFPLSQEKQLPAAPKIDAPNLDPLITDPPVTALPKNAQPEIAPPRIDPPQIDSPVKPAVEPNALPKPGADQPQILPLGGAGDVPWTNNRRSPGAAPGRQLASPHDFLRLLDIDNSQLSMLIDDRPLHNDEWETMHRLLFRIPEFTPLDMQRWRREDVTWQQVAAEPDSYRAEVFTVTGRARMIERVELPPEAADIFGYGKFYLVKIDLPDFPAGATLCTRAVPLSLPVGQEINERVRFSGLFLKSGAEQGLVFTANRMAWLPDTPNRALGATEDHVLLAEQGMDVGQLDRVMDRKTLVTSDREAFYGMLDALDRIDPAVVRQRTAGEYTFSDLLVSPNALRGHLFKLDATARRAVKILVDDPDIQQRYGIDHYYEIDAFVQLDVPIRFAAESPDEKDVVMDNNYPVIFITRELPAGLPLGDKIHEGVRLRGYFFKLWAYRSQSKAGQAGNRTQLKAQISPMLIGPAPVIVPTMPQQNEMMGMLFGGLFIAALVGVWIGMWGFSRSDAKFQRTTLARQYNLEEGETLDNLGEHDAGIPDFRYLEQIPLVETPSAEPSSSDDPEPSPGAADSPDEVPTTSKAE